MPNLERVAVHQTRLRTPGVSLDGKGVAVGARGLVLLSSLDRLVAFLAIYTEGASLAELLRSLKVQVLKSKLGAAEVALSFAADSTDRMDHVAEVAALAEGYTFTGTSRHFVQYRDKAAPFGYDAASLLGGDAALVLYHHAFRQEYAIEREVDLRQLMLRLQPHPEPTAGRAPGERWLVAEEGLGPALIHYFVRSGVEAEVGLAEWPPESSFDETPVRRYLFRASSLPERMLPLLSTTPGLSLHAVAAPGAAVEVGHRHPINLRSCPVFSEAGLVLFRGRGLDPLELPKLPAMGPVGSFARVDMRPEVLRARAAGSPSPLGIDLRMVPSSEPFRRVTATWIPTADLSLLRHIAYALGKATLDRARIAVTSDGALLRLAEGAEAIPIGEFLSEIHPGLYTPAGLDALPSVAPAVLYQALGAPADQVLVVRPDATVFGIPKGAFVSLQVALLEGQEWAPVAASPIASALDAALAAPLVEVVLTPLGARPMHDVAPLADAASLGEAES